MLDEEERNIIDKFATYVAKVGSDFERVTYEKQRDNPKFAFLTPGSQEYMYYKHKLWTLNNPNGAQQSYGQYGGQQYGQQNYQGMLPYGGIRLVTNIVYRATGSLSCT